MLLVTAVIADPRKLPIPAIAEISAPARQARAVVAAVPADSDTLPRFPRSNTGAQFIDDAHNFVSGNAGIFNSGQAAFFCEHIAVANTTGLHLDTYFSCARIRNLTLNNFEISAGPGNPCGLHCCGYR